jgi:hypothetical protein
VFQTFMCESRRLGGTLAKNHRLHQTYRAIYYFIETRLGSLLGFWSLGTMKGTWTSKKK